MNRITNLLLISTILVVYAGCAGTPVQHSGISSPSLSGIGEKVTSAQDKVKAVAKQVAKPQADTLNSAVVDLDDAKKQIAEKQGKIDALTKDYNDVAEEKDNAVRDRNNALKALWKTRLIYLPIAVAVASVVVAGLTLVFYASLKAWLKSIPVIGWLISKVIP